MPTDLPPVKNEFEKQNLEKRDEENGLDPDTFGGHTSRSDLGNDAGTPSSGPPPKRDGGSFRIATLSGIPIRLHWTFFILLAWVAWGGLNSGMQMGRASVLSVASVIALFACVVLHEMGHALTARRYGIRTQSIVLYPIGGVASLETMPRPRQELWIALAGPAVNVVIAAALFVGLRLSGTPLETLTFRNPQQSLLPSLMWANVFLGLFNLIPAFPMDGGRVLRALLARIMDEVAATGLAARVGQGLAVLFGLYSFLNGNFVLLFIAVFVYQGAQQEASAFQTRELIGGHRVREAMLREFHTLPVGSTLREAADQLLAGNQHDFPIVHGGEVVGMLSRSALLRGMANEGPDAYVAGVMLRDFARVHPDEPLENILPTISETGAILVMENGSNDANALIGMATQENLYEFLLLSQAQRSVH